jgi:hypothetical protein
LKNTLAYYNAGVVAVYIVGLAPELVTDEGLDEDGAGHLRGLATPRPEAASLEVLHLKTRAGINGY